MHPFRSAPAQNVRGWTSSAARGAVALAMALTLGACDNPCQSLCVQLSNYADECGRAIPESELNACLETWAQPDKEDLRVCRDFNAPDVVRREWTCEDVNLFEVVQ